MSRQSKRQCSTMAELIVSAQHYASEVGLPYVLVFEGHEMIFHNTTPRHAVMVLRDALELQDKMQEQIVEDKARKLTAIPDADGDSMA